MTPIANVDEIAGFVQTMLLSRYDDPVPIPAFHKEMWGMALSGSPRVGIAAPRGHAKSTAITHSLTLFLFLFRLRNYGLIVSDTEAQAAQFLGDIRNELLDNQPLRKVFGVKKLVKDQVTDIIVEMTDGHKFRLQALGAEQKVRGRKWNHKRPDYIVGDDLENDEMVESDDRRAKLRNWVMKALLPSGSKNRCLIVFVGTILHLDSVLMRVINNKSWKTKVYKAHEDFDDFSNILWPSQWPESRLRDMRQTFIDEGYSEGYAQEYLNNPIAHDEAYFKAEDFIPMEEGDFVAGKNYYAGVDFAISDADRSAFTVFAIGGVGPTGKIDAEHEVRMRTSDMHEILDAMFEVQRAFNIQCWFPEKGQIFNTIEGELIKRMEETGIYLTYDPKVPTKDKRGRARPLQARMRAGGMRWNTNANWFPGTKQEFLQFPKGLYKDRVDSWAWLCYGIAQLSAGPSKQERELDDYYISVNEYNRFSEDSGISPVTGY